MPDKKTIARAAEDRREGQAPSTQAGEFVREEVRHVRSGKHGARSAKQAIAIGLSKARRAGVKLPPAQSSARAGKTSQAVATPTAAGVAKPRSRRRAQEATAALKRRGHAAASTGALKRQAQSAAAKRSAGARSAAARKAARTRARSSG